MQKPAHTQYTIHPLLQNRWSPRAFSKDAVEEDKLQSLLEAARWASSCFNEQPWHFIVASNQHEKEHARMQTCIVAGNSWAKLAPVLMITVAKLTFTHNETSNHHAYHDIGLAVGNLVVQATDLGLSVHQMAGIFPDVAKSLYHIPDHYEALTALAIGYVGDPQSLPGELRERELAARTRRSLSDFVFSGQWGQSSPIVQK